MKICGPDSFLHFLQAGPIWFDGTIKKSPVKCRCPERKLDASTLFRFCSCGPILFWMCWMHSSLLTVTYPQGYDALTGKNPLLHKNGGRAGHGTSSKCIMFREKESARRNKQLILVQKTPQISNNAEILKNDLLQLFCLLCSLKSHQTSKMINQFKANMFI